VNDDLAHARSGFEALDGHVVLLMRGGGFLARQLFVRHYVFAPGNRYRAHPGSMGTSVEGDFLRDLDSTPG
jgi:hypothetical protein